MPRTDAEKQKIIEQLTAAAKPASDGTLYIRALKACRIMGVASGQGAAWIKQGRIKPMRFNVPRSKTAPFGRVTAWPLDQAIRCVPGKAGRRWTEKDEDFLLTHLGKKPWSWIAQEMGRTERALSMYAFRLGVSPLTNEGKLTVGQVAGLCRRSRQAVHLWCLQVGLKYSRLPNTKGVKLIDPADLLAFLKSRPRTWNGLPDASRNALERMNEEVSTPSKKTKPAPDPGPRVYRRCA